MLVGTLIAIYMLAGVVTASSGEPLLIGIEMIGSDSAAASGTDVTPSNAFLPFGPRDKYNTNFSFTAKFTREPGTASISQYTQVFDTKVVKKDQCVFYTKFGLKAPSDTFSPHCGDTCRWDSSWMD